MQQGDDLSAQAEDFHGENPEYDGNSFEQDTTVYGETAEISEQDEAVYVDRSDVIESVSSSQEEIPADEETGDEPVYCDPDPAETDLGMEESVNGSTETDNTENDTIITDLH